MNTTTARPNLSGILAADRVEPARADHLNSSAASSSHSQASIAKVRIA
jgi:hypothetical protein